MGIKKYSWMVLFILFIPICFGVQSDIEKNVIMGDLLSDALIDDVTVPMEEQIRAMQEISSGDVVQVGQKEALIEQQKVWILNRISLMWELIIGLFVLMFEIIKQCIYLLEIWFLIIIIFKIIPSIILKVRDGILKWYTKTF